MIAIERLLPYAYCSSLVQIAPTATKEKQSNARRDR